MPISCRLLRKYTLSAEAACKQHPCINTAAGTPVECVLQAIQEISAFNMLQIALNLFT